MGAHPPRDGWQKAAVGGVAGQAILSQGRQSPGRVERAGADTLFKLCERVLKLPFECGLPADRIETAHFARRRRRQHVARVGRNLLERLGIEFIEQLGHLVDELNQRLLRRYAQFMQGSQRFDAVCGGRRRDARIVLRAGGQNLFAQKSFALMLLRGLKDIVQRHIICGCAEQTIRTFAGVAQVDADLFINIGGPIGGDERMEGVADESRKFIAVAGQALVTFFPIHQIDAVKERTSQPLIRQRGGL